MKNNEIELYTDGSCLNNPGPGGVAYVVLYNTTSADGNVTLNTHQNNVGYTISTNNRMEIMAVISGLLDIVDMIQKGTIVDCDSIICHSDSKYVCDAINHRWLQRWQMNNWVTSTQTSVKNRDLWEKVIEIIDKTLIENKLSFVVKHISAHKGHEYNELADKLAKEAASLNERISDSVYEDVVKSKKH